jgi:hypothetical protein
MTTFSALVAVTTVIRVEVEVDDHEAPAASAIAAVQGGGGFREVPPTYKIVEIGRRPAEWADAL